MPAGILAAPSAAVQKTKVGALTTDSGYEPSPKRRM